MAMTPEEQAEYDRKVQEAAARQLAKDTAEKLRKEKEEEDRQIAERLRKLQRGENV